MSNFADLISGPPPDIAVKRVLLAAAAVAAVAVAALALAPGPERDPDWRPFHATLADPDLYEGGVYQRTFKLNPGSYELRFVPNGDSPRVLTVSMSGQTVSFERDFELRGTLHQTGISEYYTWEYLGEKSVVAEEAQQIRVTVDPHGNLLGPVSVSLLKEEA